MCATLTGSTWALQRSALLMEWWGAQAGLGPCQCVLMAGLCDCMTLIVLLPLSSAC